MYNINVDVNRYLQNKKTITELNQENEILGNNILKYMQEHGKKDFTTPSGVVSIIEETISFKFDTARFKEDHLAEYKTYLKESTTKAHLTTKITK